MAVHKAFGVIVTSGHSLMHEFSTTMLPPTVNYNYHRSTISTNAKNRNLMYEREQGSFHPTCFPNIWRDEELCLCDIQETCHSSIYQARATLWHDYCLDTMCGLCFPFCARSSIIRLWHERYMLITRGRLWHERYMLIIRGRLWHERYMLIIRGRLWHERYMLITRGRLWHERYMLITRGRLWHERYMLITRGRLWHERYMLITRGRLWHERYMLITK